MPTNRPTRSPQRAADLIVLPRPAPSPSFLPIHQAIVTCERCDRLRRYCQRVASEKRAAYRTETYWGRPVPGFGDPAARVFIVGLAPAAHGANRTGRVFTGDGAGGSGRLSDAGPALEWPGLASHLARPGRWAGADGSLYRRGGQVRATRQSAYAGGAGAVPAISGGGVDGAFGRTGSWSVSAASRSTSAGASWRPVVTRGAPDRPSHMARTIR